MITSKPVMPLPADDFLLRRNAVTGDAFGADEGQVRMDLVQRVRAAIDAGEYDEESRLDAAIDRLVADLI